MLVQKNLKFEDVQLKMSGDTGIFAGYASVFGGVDSYNDTILKGAFQETLSKAMPKMFYNHSWGMPVGKWTKAIEDGTGLYVEGELTNGLAMASDIKAAMMHQTLDGLSIGGYLSKGDYTEKDGVRIIKKWSNLTEVSVVVFPADSAARIDLNTVKSIDFETVLPDCKTERDIERLLRDAGLGKWESMAIVTRTREIFRGRDAYEIDEQKTQALILERLNKLNLKF